jgi:hypothetical protein
MARAFSTIFGSLFVRGTLRIAERTFASLPTDPKVGELANISDSDTATSGATIGGSSTNHVLGRFDGSVWKVIS